MQTERDDVLISGASFAGLTLAIALADVLGGGLSVAVLDRAGPMDAAASEGGDPRASALSAASQQLLATLGVWPLIESSAEPVARIEITDSSLSSGIRPVRMAYDNTTDAGGPATWIVPNAALLAALFAVVRRHAAITLRFGAPVTGLEISPHGATVTLGDGSRRSASLVVAADGRRSVLREAAGIKVVGWDYGQTGIVTAVTHERPHNGVAVQHFLPAGPFAILPLPGNRSCITWSEETNEARRILSLDDQRFLDEVDLRFGGRLGPLTLAGPRRSWPLEMHLARSYVADRLALVGDAAHGVHPIAGQGLNLALRDVAALVEVVADAARLGLDISSADALARYQSWRRFDSMTSAMAYDGLNRLFSNDWTLVRAAREFGLGLVDRMPGMKQFFVQEAAGLTGELPKLLRGERV
jgi:2-octaprenyl-6-methoxyphenol hydroxylase